MDRGQIRERREREEETVEQDSGEMKRREIRARGKRERRADDNVEAGKNGETIMREGGRWRCEIEHEETYDDTREKEESRETRAVGRDEMKDKQ